MAARRDHFDVGTYGLGSTMSGATSASEQDLTLRGAGRKVIRGGTTIQPQGNPVTFFNIPRTLEAFKSETITRNARKRLLKVQAASVRHGLPIDQSGNDTFAVDYKGPTTMFNGVPHYGEDSVDEQGLPKLGSVRPDGTKIGERPLHMGELMGRDPEVQATFPNGIREPENGNKVTTDPTYGPVTDETFQPSIQVGFPDKAGMGLHEARERLLERREQALPKDSRDVALAQRAIAERVAQQNAAKEQQQKEFAVNAAEVAAKRARNAAAGIEEENTFRPSLVGLAQVDKDKNYLGQQFEGTKADRDLNTALARQAHFETKTMSAPAQSTFDRVTFGRRSAEPLTPEEVAKQSARQEEAAEERRVAIASQAASHFRAANPELHSRVESEVSQLENERESKLDALKTFVLDRLSTPRSSKDNLVVTAEDFEKRPTPFRTVTNEDGTTSQVRTKTSQLWNKKINRFTKEYNPVHAQVMREYSDKITAARTPILSHVAHTDPEKYLTDNGIAIPNTLRQVVRCH